MDTSGMARAVLQLLPPLLQNQVLLLFLFYILC